MEKGIKTIELRLNDFKRRLIRPGDRILFVNRDKASKILETHVKNLYLFSSFKELYRTLPLDRCGYTKEEISMAIPEDMERYYSKERHKVHGVLGIEIEKA